MPLELPPAPMNLAVRMLLLHGELWHQIGEQDLQLLHELPGEHGQLIAWLERFLVDNGPTPWAVLQVALQEADLMDLAQRVSGGPLTARPATSTSRRNSAKPCASCGSASCRRTPTASPAARSRTWRASSRCSGRSAT